MKERLKLLLIPLVCFCLSIWVSPQAYATTTRTKVCTKKVKAGTARCFAQIRTRGAGALATKFVSDGLTPQDFKNAYGAGNKATHIAVVAAYNAPTIAEDLRVYSATFGLPLLPACKTGQQTDCFTKVAQDGTANYPSNNASWALESSMDVEAVHAMCPHCRITLVEARSTSYDDLSSAADRAVAMGAKIVSNSYGIAESPLQKAYDSSYVHPGVVFTVSSGDSGYGTNWPATSPNVIAVGGTTLNMRGSTVINETAWSGTGSGCSKYEAKPRWQKDSACTHRSVADVSADADPATGAAVYSSYSLGGQNGWFVVGGTSLAAPLVAGILGSTGAFFGAPQSLYSNSHVKDVTSGKNGNCSTYLCKSTKGYDGPSGLGVLHF